MCLLSDNCFSITRISNDPLKCLARRYIQKCADIEVVDYIWDCSNLKVIYQTILPGNTIEIVPNDSGIIHHMVCAGKNSTGEIMVLHQYPGEEKTNALSGHLGGGIFLEKLSDVVDWNRTSRMLIFYCPSDSSSQLCRAAVLHKAFRAASTAYHPVLNNCETFVEKCSRPFPTYHSSISRQVVDIYEKALTLLFLILTVIKVGFVLKIGFVETICLVSFVHIFFNYVILSIFSFPRIAIFPFVPSIISTIYGYWNVVSAWERLRSNYVHDVIKNTRIGQAEDKDIDAAELYFELFFYWLCQGKNRVLHIHDQDYFDDDLRRKKLPDSKEGNDSSTRPLTETLQALVFTQSSLPGERLSNYSFCRIIYFLNQILNQTFFYLTGDLEQNVGRTISLYLKLRGDRVNALISKSIHDQSGKDQLLNHLNKFFIDIKTLSIALNSLDKFSSRDSTISLMHSVSIILEDKINDISWWTLEDIENLIYIMREIEIMFIRRKSVFDWNLCNQLVKCLGFLKGRYEIRDCTDDFDAELHVQEMKKLLSGLTNRFVIEVETP